MDVLQSPFRFTSDGNAARVTQGSDAHKAQQLAALVRISPGELPLAPTYGVANNLFSVVEPATIAAQILTFHPDVVIQDIVVYQTDTGRDAYEISFTSEVGTGDQ